MCAPALAAPLIIASTVTAAAGTLVGGLQQASQYRYAAKVAERNAKLEAEGARNAQENGQLELRRHWRRVGQVAGQQQAAMAANGIDTSFGSALQVQQDTAMLAAEDAGQIMRATDENIRSFDIRASNERAQARGARQQASGAITGAAFGTMSTLLGGASQYSKYQAGR
jgi:hypothetical protein